MSPNRYVWLFVLTALGGIGCSGDDLTEDSNKFHDALTTGHIQVSRSADRSASVALDGKTKSGVIYVFAEGLSTSVSRVDFRLDGTLVGSEQHAPYDLKGTSATGNANPWDTGAVANGSHTLETTTCFRRVRHRPRRPSRFPIRRQQAGAEVRRERRHGRRYLWQRRRRSRRGMRWGRQLPPRLPARDLGDDLLRLFQQQ